MVKRLNKALRSENRDAGFTLIELLVVIIIIGILAAIAIPVFLNQRKKGVDASLKSDLKNAATAAETYSTDNPTAANFGANAAAVLANFTAAGFRKSPGNTVNVSGSPASGYVLCAFNSGASVATDGTAGKSLTYNSNAGGLQSAPLAGACTGDPIG